MQFRNPECYKCISDNSSVCLVDLHAALYPSLILGVSQLGMIRECVPFTYSQLCLQAGTGKTLLVEKLAAEGGLPLLCLAPSSVLSKWAGDSEKTLKKVELAHFNEKFISLYPDSYSSTPDLKSQIILSNPGQHDLYGPISARKFLGPTIMVSILRPVHALIGKF